MGNRWVFGACMIGAAWLGCTGADATTSPSNDGVSAAGQGGTAASVVPQGGVTGTAGTAGGAGAAGTQSPGAQPDASLQPQPAGAGGLPDASVQPPQPDSGQPGAGPWTLLMEKSWSLEAGGEAPQSCGDLMLTEDIYVAAIRPIHPLGTHHTTLSVTPTPTACSSSALFTGGIIYAAGVGSEELHLPAGVAMKLPAGNVLHLGLHLYNTSDQPLSGVSGVEIIRVDPEDVEHEAELMLSGPVRLMIEPGRQTVSHSCTVTEDQTLFAIFPHMHQLGVHMKTTVVAGGRPQVVHDAEYLFEEQFQIPLTPLQLGVGDTITTECTFENTTGGTVGFGESSDTEMCFSIFFRYPATGNSFCGRGM